ncbi:glycosyltransferase family 39 protein [Rhodopseudomonas palustris]|uniref:Glycosyltransferase RgtA/B/C/D-like domain-containing protein n=1 Tax=Rhodopseudomonas palustris (strain BisB18) TaxID=316056 RepID=Q21BR9_RHOPB
MFSRLVVAPFTRWIDALLDSRRQNRAVIWTLAAYAAIWTGYRALATMPRDLHADVTELYGWSRDLAFGYDKHPPFSAAVAKAWLSVFPATDLSFHLLATVNIALTLYIAFRTMRRYLPAEKTVFGLALLMLIPFFNFIALKYNANAVLLPLWAVTIHCFLRAYERRNALWAALAGLGAGAAMLGKYWSIVLIAGLGLAALIDSRRVSFFRSKAPWIMAGVGLVVIAPHLAWLVQHHFPTFAYAAAHSAPSFSENLAATAGYLAGCVGYVAVPLIVAILLLRPTPEALLDVVAPKDPSRRLILVIQLLLIVVPAPFALMMGLRIVPLWTMPAWTLLPIVALGSPLIAVGRVALERLVAGTAIGTLAMLALAPVVALTIHLNSPPGSFEYASLLAEKIEQQWRQRSALPIPLVAGTTVLPANTAYYLQTRARSFENADVATLKAAAQAHGAVLVCPAEDAGCIAVADQIVAGQSEISRSEVRLSRPLFGFAGDSVRDVFMMVWPPVPPPALPVPLGGK